MKVSSGSYLSHILTYDKGKRETLTKEASTKFDVIKHELVPKHAKLSDKDKQKLLDTYNITLRELPKIDVKDPVIAALGDCKEGDVVKITRKSPTAGEALFYRRVAHV